MSELKSKLVFQFEPVMLQLLKKWKQMSITKNDNSIIMEVFSTFHILTIKYSTIIISWYIHIFYHLSSIMLFLKFDIEYGRKKQNQTASFSNWLVCRISAVICSRMHNAYKVNWILWAVISPISSRWQRSDSDSAEIQIRKARIAKLFLKLDLASMNSY